MNELEKYAQSLLIETAPFDHEGNYANNMIKRGFDAAIALDLPVKFDKWVREGGDFGLGILYYSPDLYKFRNAFLSTKELYQYWLDNVYKP
jgi:hypothetical protein